MKPTFGLSETTPNELTTDQKAAISGANSPSAANVFATMADITGGGGIIEITYADLMTAIAGSTLAPGTFYKVTDRGDRWILFQAVSTNQLATDGQRLMLCPSDYAIETDAFGNVWLGVWNAGLTPSAGNLTIWGGQVWSNVAGNVGTAVDEVTLDADWTLITKAGFTNNEYTEMQFGCQYDWTNDYVVKQWDSKGNTAFYSAIVDAYQNCNISDWNIFSSGIVFYNNLCRGFFNNVILSSLYNNVTPLINDNIVDDLFNNNVVVSISSNITPFISSNIIAQNINFNIATVSISVNICGTLEDNTANDIFNNETQGISGNVASGDIKYNKCTEINDNITNIVDISYNINNGSIQNCEGTLPISITHNTNNGDISGTFGSDVTDPIVNKN